MSLLPKLWSQFIQIECCTWTHHQSMFRCLWGCCQWRKSHRLQSVWVGMWWGLPQTVTSLNPLSTNMPSLCNYTGRCDTMLFLCRRYVVMCVTYCHKSQGKLSKSWLVNNRHIWYNVWCTCRQFYAVCYIIIILAHITLEPITMNIMYNCISWLPQAEIHDSC